MIEGRYEYTPCPLTICRPTAAVFLHYLKRPDCPTRRWFQRVSKKLSPAVLNSYHNAHPYEDVIGWGVQIIEGPNKKAISWMCLMLLGLSAVVSISYAQLRDDASSGFAIGAYLLTGGALVLSAFYFQWREESMWLFTTGIGCQISFESYRPCSATTLSTAYWGQKSIHQMILYVLVPIVLAFSFQTSSGATSVCLDWNMSKRRLCDILR